MIIVKCVLALLVGVQAPAVGDPTRVFTGAALDAVLTAGGDYIAILHYDGSVVGKSTSTVTDGTVDVAAKDACAIATDGRILFVGTRHGSVEEYVLPLPPSSQPVRSTLLGKGDVRLLAPCEDGGIVALLAEAKRARAQPAFLIHAGAITALPELPLLTDAVVCGHRLFLVARDGSCGWIDLRRLDVPLQTIENVKWVYSICTVESDGVLVGTTADPRIGLLGVLRTPAQLVRISTQGRQVSNVEVVLGDERAGLVGMLSASDIRDVVLAGVDGHPWLFNSANLRPMLRLPGAMTYSRLSLSRDGSAAVGVGDDGSLWLWRLTWNR